MITINYKLIFPALALVLLGGVSVAKTGQAYAETANGSGNALVQRVAEKFNLNKDDVQTVFNQFHEERHSRMASDYEARLDQAVKDGKLTEEKKQLVLEKRNETESWRQSAMNSGQTMTPEQRRSQMETHRQELEKWASDNGIDISYLMGMRGGRGGPHGMGGD